MKLVSTAIPDIKIVEPQVFGDERGFFMETWQIIKFREAGISAEFVQDNHSRSIRGTLRGLHYQIKYPQGKLVRVVVGEIFDVAVDLRKSSPTFGQWVSQYLSADNKRMLWIPPGFAHGFYVISEFAESIYKCTDFWHPKYERTLSWDDPNLGINWPLVNDLPPLLSSKDTVGSMLIDAEHYQ